MTLPARALSVRALSVALGVALAGVALGVHAEAATAQMMGDHLYTYVAFDELEYVANGDERPVEVDGQGWIGGDDHRFWFKARAEAATGSREGRLEAQALYSRAVSAWWNLQAGLRLDRHYGEDVSGTRGLFAVGVEGLAPYWFEVESFLYVSQRGDVSARLEASYDLLLTQRFVLEPELELNAAVQEVEEFGVGSGLGELELGARLRYEIVPEFAPYLGVSWLRLSGGTAAHLERRAAGGASLVAGLRWWY
jgi:copper resistance protein B